MLEEIVGKYNKLKENDAMGLLLQPKVIANFRTYQREFAERPVVMRSTPPGVEIELTNRCNLACIQCLRSLGLKPYKLGDIDFENYKKILAQFPYVMNLSLNGFGEPFMHKQFFEIVEYSRAQRPWAKIGIYTNGILIDEEKTYRLMDCGLTELDISIDAAYPETYRRVRRGGRLPVLHDNIRRLMKAREETGARFPLIGLNFVMVNENEGELVPFVEQANEFGVDFINCITYAAYDWGFKNRRTRDSYKRELEAAHKRVDELGVRVKTFPSDDISWSDPSRQFDCGFFWGENFRIAYEGTITLGCCTPFKESYSYGNVLQQPFGEIWNNEFYQRNRELAKQGIPPTKICAACDGFCKGFFGERGEDTISFIPASSLLTASGGR